ncbi:MAG: hypothetical protein COA79_18770 [Planctomycetota bacterium]|nr:MAG: hypothetical protein COA79_18770 [Planctomycetota bacterium]
MPVVNKLKTMDDFHKAINESNEHPVLICKFSPVCPTSAMAEREFESFISDAPTEAAYYTLDVIYDRDVARGLSKEINIRHESPQALLFKNEECVWHDSHYELTKDTFQEEVSKFI